MFFRTAALQLKKLLRILGVDQSQETVRFELDTPFHVMLSSLAMRERRTPDDVAADLVRHALVERQLAEDGLVVWRALSPREQEVAALICLDNTNRQIAARLGISPETVKTHVRNVLSKFGLHTKAELRQALSGWDFSAWR
jgi:DNA-binding CsgD family transcriptional regulator